MGNIDKCATDIYDDYYGKVCIVCNSGYGLGGKCTKNGCKKCVKCGNNCRTCRFCVCTECQIGNINPADPNNCLEIGGVTDIEKVTGYEDLLCGSDLIKINIFFILLILLFLRKK